MLSESTFQRALAAVDLKCFEFLLLQWQNAQITSTPDLLALGLVLFLSDCQRPQPVREKIYPIWSERHSKPMVDLMLKHCLQP